MSDSSVPASPPSLSIWWADNRKALSRWELTALVGERVVVDVNEAELLLMLPDGRKVVVRGITDPIGPEKNGVHD